MRAQTRRARLEARVDRGGLLQDDRRRVAVRREQRRASAGTLRCSIALAVVLGRAAPARPPRRASAGRARESPRRWPGTPAPCCRSTGRTCRARRRARAMMSLTAGRAITLPRKRPDRRVEQLLPARRPGGEMRLGARASLARANTRLTCQSQSSASLHPYLMYFPIIGSRSFFVCAGTASGLRDDRRRQRVLAAAGPRRRQPADRVGNRLLRRLRVLHQVAR